MTSYNPNDIKHGYCGKCHGFTRRQVDERRALDVQGLRDY